MTLANRHGTHTQRYYFDGTDLVAEKFFKKYKPEKVTTTNVTTRFYSPTTTESTKIPNQFNAVLVFAITLVASFILCIIIIFIIFLSYVKYYKARGNFKNFIIPPVIAETSNFSNNIHNHDQTFGEPVMLETFSMLESNRNIDETEENEYEEIYEYPQLRDSYQYHNEHNSENLLETSNRRINFPEHIERDDNPPSSSSNSTSISTSSSSSSSQYVTHDQVINQNSQNLSSTVPKSTYVKWENSFIMAPQLDLNSSEEPDIFNTECSDSERNDTYVTTQFLNKAYRYQS